jgi:plasmid stabilization system protein ParE
MAEIIWTDEAISDVNAIGEYFERTSPQYASVVVNERYTAVEPLAEYPRMGRQVPEVASSRRLAKQVLTILHSRQDVKKKRRRREE